MEKEYTLNELLPYEQPGAYIVQSTDYNDAYKTPVLTAGKTFILGYTNEIDGIFDRLPVIIFDDFTTASQYVNFKFKVKSSAMKILNINTELVIPKYIYYQMQVINIDHSTHKRYWIQQYSKIKIKVPPISEQQRIVSRIEEIFSSLDNAVEMLNMTKKQLIVYRQAVLKEVFDYSDDSDIVELQNIVDDIRIGPFGTMLHKSDYIDAGIPVINPQHIKNQKIHPSVRVSISEEKAKELESYRIRTNDVVMGRRGEMGRTAPVTSNEEGWICGTGSIIVRLKPEYDAVFYSQILASQDTVHYLEKKSTGTTMNNLNEDIVKHIPVPKITVKEQCRIKETLDSKISVCGNIEQTVDTVLAQAEAMRQSILKEAFEGRLA